MYTWCASTMQSPLLDILIIKETGACTVGPVIFPFFLMLVYYVLTCKKMEDEAGWMTRAHNIGSEMKEYLKVINFKTANSSATNGDRSSREEENNFLQLKMLRSERN
jgi:hypothetical protein